MDIANHLIRSLIQVKTSLAQNELQRASAELEESLFRYALFEKEQKYVHYYSIFNSIDHMKKVSAIIENIRCINQIGWQSLNKLNALSTQNSTNKQEQWKEIRSEFLKFKINLDQLSISADEGEKIYISSLQTVFNHMIGFTDSIQQTDSDEEMQSFIEKLEISLADQTKNFPDLFADTQISYIQSDLDNFLSTLRLKKKANLFVFTEKMKSFLTSNMVHIVS